MSPYSSAGGTLRQEMGPSQVAVVRLDQPRRGPDATAAKRRPSAPGEGRGGAPGAGEAVPKLGELLLEKRYITGGQLTETLLQQSVSGKRLGALLVELGILDEANLAAALAEQLSLPLIDLSDQVPEPGALEMLPETVARSLGALPLRNTAAGLEIAVADPGPRTKEELSRAAGSPVLLLVASPSDVKRAIDSFYRALAGIESEVRAFQLTESARQAEPVLQRAVSTEAAVVKVVTLVLTQALRDRASDVHVEPQQDRLRVRY